MATTLFFYSVGRVPWSSTGPWPHSVCRGEEVLVVAASLKVEDARTYFSGLLALTGVLLFAYFD